MITHRGMSTGTSDQNGGHGPSCLKAGNPIWRAHDSWWISGLHAPYKINCTTVPFPAMQRLLIGKIVLFSMLNRFFAPYNIAITKICSLALYFSSSIGIDSEMVTILATQPSYNLTPSYERTAASVRCLPRLVSQTCQTLQLTTGNFGLPRGILPFFGKMVGEFCPFWGK